MQPRQRKSNACLVGKRFTTYEAAPGRRLPVGQNVSSFFTSLPLGSSGSLPPVVGGAHLAVGGAEVLWRAYPGSDADPPSTAIAGRASVAGLDGRLLELEMVAFDGLRDAKGSVLTRLARPSRAWRRCDWRGDIYAG